MGYLRAISKRSLGGTVVEHIECTKFSHGQSNPTFLVSINGGERELVLRKKPPPPILPSAHAIEREYEVLCCLFPLGFPVPEPIALCKEAHVLGTPFYLMSFVKGEIYKYSDLRDVDDEHGRREIYFEMARVLARLHSIDPSRVGLRRYGRAEGYVGRQIDIWNRQYMKSQLDGEQGVALGVKMRQLCHVLQRHEATMKGRQTPSASCLAHGDFRLDNLVYDQSTRKVVAVLDWELSTLGDPFCDLAYSCLPYYIPHNAIPQLALPQNPPLTGIPSIDEYIQVYCHERGIERPGNADWNFYVSLSLFRLTSILAGVRARARQGNASSSEAAVLASEDNISALAQIALRLMGDRTSSFDDYMFHSGSIYMGESSLEEKSLLERLMIFMRAKVLPAECILTEHAASDKRWSIHPLQEELKVEAKRQGLWNLWIAPDLAEKIGSFLQSMSLSEDERILLAGPKLTNASYAKFAEVMGYSVWASEIFNCSAPDTGNMEVLARYGNIPQQKKWLLPLLRGDVRSCFAMTEQNVASSDATNIQSSIHFDQGSNEYILNGKKWWISGACDPRCKVAIFMGKTTCHGPVHKQQSMILVPMPNENIINIKPLTVFGYDDAPHGHAEMEFDNVRVPKENVILGEGRGFEIAQGRLGPGRLHHCMRLLGMGERAIFLCLDRIHERKSFGKRFYEHQLIRADLARCRVDLDAARLVVHNAAAALDAVGSKAARSTISIAKVYTPSAVLAVVDRVIQIFGGAGVSDKFPLASIWSAARTLRLADGPDNVHLETIAKMEIRKASL